MSGSVVVENLVKIYGDLHAVDDLSFEVGPGEVLGFLGPNGAGKSTTMKMITGFLPPTSGRVSVCGHPVATKPQEAKKCLGYLPEGAPAYSEMTPWQFLNFVADIRRPENRRGRLDWVIGQLGLEPVLHRPVDTLSKGYRRRVGLAQAMLHDPRVLIMDEPTDGLDPNQKRQVRDFINEMAHDKTIIISTHILEEVEAICTRAIIVSEGKILVDEPPGELRCRSRYYNAVTIQAQLKESVRAALGELEDVAVVEPERNQGLTLIPRPGCMLEDAVRDVLLRHNLKEVPLHIQAGRLDDVFHTLTHNVHE
ncbi:MAG: ABC transporter ATP-binding protein [Gammaproteobacteria bacterium]|nr:ABC transporter ATP-binding protein [Gammaproteobacteria bacterium]